MAETHLQGNPIQTVNNLPQIDTIAPDFTVTKADLSELHLSDLAGKTVLLNIFPSIDTGVCAASVRRFNMEAAKLENVVIVGVSQDLPFALERFCAAEGIKQVITTSAFRSSFGNDYGVKLANSPMKGLLARAIIIIDTAGKIKYTQLVEEITHDPDFTAALKAL